MHTCIYTYICTYNISTTRPQIRHIATTSPYTARRWPDQFRVHFPGGFCTTEFAPTRFQVLLYLILTIAATLLCVCGVESFLVHLPELEHLIDIRFHGLFSEKEHYQGLWTMSSIWGQLHRHGKTFPTRLLGLLDKRSKIWRYGRSWTLFGEKKKNFGQVVQNWSCQGTSTKKPQIWHTTNTLLILLHSPLSAPEVPHAIFF